ncbi:MAG TPA: MFS transporter [Fimbriimonadaceae bacterium]|nr:MFS transporter [Fimbriimonadaceae bacterium]
MELTEEASLRRDWARFTAVTLLFGFGFAVYSGVFQNFMKDELHATQLNYGVTESIREIPGLMAALMAGTLVAFAESRIAAIGLAITGIGIAWSGFVHALPPLVAVTFFWSVGFHLWATVQNAITMALAKGKEGGRHLGRMGGISQYATIAALGFAAVGAMLMPRNMYLPYFLVGGASILAAAVFCASLTHHAHTGVRHRIVLRREYWLYYLLTFLEGCRRQIFSIFAALALILVYHQDVRQMLFVQLINAVLIAVTAPWMGRIFDRVGERGPLSAYAIGLIVVFIGYAMTRNVVSLYALYLIDNILFSFGVGFTTYIHRIARPGDLTPSLAMGVTMNHIAAVTVPIGGAYLWARSGNYQVPFWVGVGIAGVSLVFTRFLPHGPAPKPA